MTQFTFASLTNGQHLTFNPSVDKLHFGASTDNATAVRLSFSANNLGFSYQGKTIWLDSMAIGQVSLTNVTFANGSVLGIGDGTANIFADWYGQEYTLQTSTVGNQIWGLGGADVIRTGSGADWLIGNSALMPLNHVSRNGLAGLITGSSYASVSADGRYVDFVTNDHIYTKDMVTGTLTDEHVSSTGVPGGSGAGGPVVSADGKVVVFTSASSGLVPGPADGSLYDLYLANVGSSTGIQRVSIGTNGLLATDGRSEYADLSNTGRYVVFQSSTSNWAAGGSTAYSDIFLKDRVSGSLTRISTSTTGTDGNGESSGAKISADGRFVVFQSEAKNLSVGDTNGYTDIFVWDRNDGSLTNLTKDLTVVSNPNNGCFRPDVAFDNGWGGVIVFQTGKNLVAQDTSNGTDIYAYNMYDDTLQLVSSKADGSGVQLSSEAASISGDGRFVVFTSYSDALAPGDTNGTRDIFVKDLHTGAIARVSQSAIGGAVNNNASMHAQISLGGEWIVFESSASNLVSTDGNGTFTDVFRVSNPLLKDTLIGGAGNDTYEINRPDIITEAVNGGIDTVRSTISYTLGANLENLVLTGASNLNGTGNALNNVITGNAGNNVLNGSGGVNTVSYANANGAVTVNLATVTAQTTGFGNDTLNNFENIVGSGLNDKLTGNTGNNRLDGGLGNDTLVGGTGNDTYVANSSADVIVEPGTSTTEIDTVLSSVNWTLGARLENLTLTGSSAINGGGNSLANIINGNSAVNSLIGYGGNDKLNGSSGNDTLDGGAGNDVLDGGLGNDTLKGGAGNDIYIVNSSADAISESGADATDIETVFSSVSWTLQPLLENLTLTGTIAINGGGNTAANKLTGNAAANTLIGYGGNDTLSGGGGNDILIGGTGKDGLAGGSGNDTFDFNTLSDLGLGSANRDVIADFVRGQDKIDLSTIDTNPANSGDQAFVFRDSATFSAAGQVRYAAGIVSINTDADTAAEYEIQLTGTVPASLAASDFIL